MLTVYFLQLLINLKCRMSNQHLRLILRARRFTIIHFFSKYILQSPEGQPALLLH